MQNFSDPFICHFKMWDWVFLAEGVSLDYCGIFWKTNFCSLFNWYGSCWSTWVPNGSNINKEINRSYKKFLLGAFDTLSDVLTGTSQNNEDHYCTPMMCQSLYTKLYSSCMFLFSQVLYMLECINTSETRQTLRFGAL